MSALRLPRIRVPVAAETTQIPGVTGKPDVRGSSPAMTLGWIESTGSRSRMPSAPGISVSLCLCGDLFSSSLMRHAGGAVLVDQVAVGEALEREGLGQPVRPLMGQRVGEDVARAWRRLEAAGAPAAVEVEALD